MSEPLSLQEIDRITQRLIEVGEDWADKHAAAEALDDATDKIKANAFLEAKGNIEERKAKALISEEYQSWRAQSTEARRAANKARVRYDTGKIHVELRRSQESTRRAEMTLR